MRRQELVSSFSVDVHFFFENDPKIKQVLYNDMTVEVMQGTLYFETNSLFIIITQKGTFCIFCCTLSVNKQYLNVDRMLYKQLKL